MSNWNNVCGSFGDVQGSRRRDREEEEFEQKQIFRDIGNVRVDIDNQSISILVLVLIGLFTGALDNTAVRSALDSLTAKKA